MKPSTVFSMALTTMCNTRFAQTKVGLLKNEGVVRGNNVPTKLSHVS